MLQDSLIAKGLRLQVFLSMAAKEGAAEGCLKAEQGISVGPDAEVTLILMKS